VSDSKILFNRNGLKKTFISEGGNNYRHFSQDMDPVMDRVKYLNEKVNGATRAENRSGYQYLGSVPVTMITDWLEKHNYTLNDFAINAGGQKGKTDPTGPGVKDKFMKYFLSRDFAKLHTTHATNKVSDRGIIYTGD